MDQVIIKALSGKGTKAQSEKTAAGLSVPV